MLWQHQQEYIPILPKREVPPQQSCVELVQSTAADGSTVVEAVVRLNEEKLQRGIFDVDVSLFQTPPEDAVPDMSFNSAAWTTKKEYCEVYDEQIRSLKAGEPVPEELTRIREKLKNERREYDDTTQVAYLRKDTNRETLPRDFKSMTNYGHHTTATLECAADLAAVLVLAPERLEKAGDEEEGRMPVTLKAGRQGFEHMFTAFKRANVVFE